MKIRQKRSKLIAKWESIEELEEALHILDTEVEGKYGPETLRFRGTKGYYLMHRIYRAAYDSCRTCLTNKHAYVERDGGSYPEGTMYCGQCKGEIREMNYG